MKNKIYALLSILFWVILPLFAQEKTQDEDISRKVKYYIIEAHDAIAKGEYQKAIDMYSQCLILDSENANAHYELANLAIQLNDANTAFEQAKLAVQYAPKNNWYQLLLAQIMEYRGMLKQTADVYKTLSELEPQSSEYYMKRCVLLTTAEEWNDALEAYKDYENQFGTSFEILVQKQDLYDKAGKTKEAYSELQRLIKTAPTPEKKAEYKSLLALRYSQDGEEKKAQKIYKEIKEDNVQNGITAIVLAQQFLKNNDFENTSDFLAKSINSGEIAEDANVKLFVDYLRADTTKLSDTRIYSLAKLLIEQYPNNAMGYIVFAGNTENTDAQKMEYLQKGLAIDPTNYSGLIQLTQLYGKMEKFVKMKDIAQLGIEAYPQQAPFYYLRGIASSQLEQYDIAESSLETALLYSDNEGMKDNIKGSQADTYYKAGNHDKAFQIYEELLNKKPDNVPILNNYSYFLSVEGKNLDKAEQMIQKVMEIESENPTYLDTYAWILYKKEQYAEALEYIEKAIHFLDDKKDGSAEMYKHYGDILEKLGKTKKAVTEWKKALEFPDAEKEKIEEKIQKYAQ